MEYQYCLLGLWRRFGSEQRPSFWFPNPKVIERLLCNLLILYHVNYSHLSRKYLARQGVHLISFLDQSCPILGEKPPSAIRDPTRATVPKARDAAQFREYFSWRYSLRLGSKMHSQPKPAGP